MKTKLLAILTIMAAGIIAGCGGGGTSTPASSPTTSITGKVADGYLVGATVFLDKNGNYLMDSGESSATTDQNGAYTLTMDPADVGKYPIVAIATKGVTIDKDTGTAVTNSYMLSMPALAVSGSANSNFISPMSSQLREMMATGKYATMQDAMDALLTQLGMPGIDMLSDYMVANNVAMHTAAQNMASLMGSQMPQVFHTTGSTATVDVNRYREMMGTIFSNMSSIKGQNAQTAMTNLMGEMTVLLTNMPMMNSGQSFQNMSTAFRGGLMSGTGAGGMMR
ncbi:MAG: hypothetical protein PHF56_20900 [Desulfuromonadaceae bacterium]|nr:hypothetical protein [Desulfuromonadaceae bacterium]